MTHIKGRTASVKVIRKASAGQDCTLRLPGVCREDPSYTVGAHLRVFNIAGMAQKPDDLFIVDACDRCHDALDRRGAARVSAEDILLALIRTQRRRRAAGLIVLKGER